MWSGLFEGNVGIFWKGHLPKSRMLEKDWEDLKTLMDFSFIFYANSICENLEKLKKFSCNFILKFNNWLSLSDL